MRVPLYAYVLPPAPAREAFFSGRVVLGIRVFVSLETDTLQASRVWRGPSVRPADLGAAVRRLLVADSGRPWSTRVGRSSR